ATVALCWQFSWHRELLWCETNQLSAYAKAWDLAASGAELSTISAARAGCVHRVRLRHDLFGVSLDIENYCTLRLNFNRKA
ncbi:MAG TPA: hypothetical protein DEQ29_01495, partial [Escherichia coli]|nr:hypothetical protein [Escherichia coli]